MTVLPITLHTLHQIMRHAPKKYLDPLNDAMDEYDIDSAKRVAAFLSQLAVESSELRHTHEKWTNKYNFSLPGVKRAAFTAQTDKEYFEHWYGNRPELGNDKPGDGFKYRGRGSIQITGKNTYRLVGTGIGEPLIEQPQLLESDITVDMYASAYFFSKYARLCAIADRVNPHDATSVQHVNHMLTHGVNKGINGLIERLHYYRRALRALSA
ncbi:glycoside hydrolase family 19 protein [Paraburkholderia unamae]|uniref:Chitinase n=1 Tax=Paraburkholderia unamae TaxID=219649 RepID=A0ABX5KTF3_9BURK|nr:glycoside hydrolase family 19 protein [Paraburkholderia unamae]PVX86395.1 putative chitinase [Paraburkholderia unamae]